MSGERLNKVNTLVILILPVLMIISGFIVFYTGDAIIGSILMILGVIFYVLNKSGFKEKKIPSNAEKKETTINSEVLPSSSSKAVESRKAICPNCKALIPIEADTCPLCGTQFQNYRGK